MKVMDFRNLALAIILFVTVAPALAEEAKPVAPTPVTFGRNGITFTQPDNLFQVNMRFRMQNLATLYTGMHSDPSFHSFEGWDARVRRLRLRFGGFVYDPRLTFNIQLSFTREDMDWENSKFPNVVRDAVVMYRFNPYVQVWFGQTKLPGNRQRIISSGDQQFPDRSIVNANFNIDRDFGVQGLFTALPGDMIFNLRTAITTGSGRNRPNTQNVNPPEVSPLDIAYSARLDFLPFGAFTDGGDYFEGDLLREPTPKLSIAAAYSLIYKSNRANGTIGRFYYATLGTPSVVSSFPPSGSNWQPLLRDMQVAFVDSVFKYRGFALSAEYAHRAAANPILGLDSSGRTVSLLTGFGLNVQASYMVLDKLELATRYSLIVPEDEVRSAQRRIEVYGLGSSYYVYGHRVKFQTDLTQERRYNYTNSSTQYEWIWRINSELGI